MKTILKSALLLFFMAFCIQSCQDDDDVAAPADVQINSFVWTGLNAVYLWQADVPNLSDTRFANENDFNNFLRGYSKPEDLFEDLLNKPESKYPNGDAIDRFSWIVSDYTVLEQELNGITKNSGIDFRLSRQTSGSDNLVGYVRYIIPNSNASNNGDIKRGDLFTSVNGTPLTASNYEALLLNSDSFTLNLATYNGASFVLTGKSVALTKTVLEENPILIKKVINLSNTDNDDDKDHKVGYLMYNGFYADYDEELNNAFLDFKGVKDFILDLRYNGGGSVHSSTLLASLITGRFPGQIFSKRQYNPKLMKDLTSEDLESLNERFMTKTDEGVALNSLQMTTVYIITTDNTASASEMVINGLKPYINVVQVGETTVGKNVGSFTVYDSPTLNKKDVNPNHKYAMQPLVFKITNSAGFGDYTQGLVPNFQQFEYIDNYGVLGDINEPLLSLTISQITGVTSKKIQSNKILHLPYFSDSKKNNKFKNEMYLDKIPAEFQRR